MCCRFFQDVESSQVLKDILAEAARRQMALTGVNTVAHGEVFPSDVIAALALSKNGCRASFPMHWGFQRRDGKGLIVNTRSETANTSPLFRDSLRTRRCLIPASWYYEWETRNLQQNLFETEAGLSSTIQIEGTRLSPARRSCNTQKIKHAIRPNRQGLIYLAAIYRYEPDQKLPVCSILTRNAAPDIVFIHPRMPVIFSEETALQWLDPQTDPVQLMAQCRMDMSSHAVKEKSHA